MVSGTGQAGTSDCVLLEDLKDAFGEIDELVERWENRISVNNTSFSERYLKGEMKIAIVFQSFRVCAQEHIAIFERKDLVSGSKVEEEDVRCFCGFQGGWKGNCERQFSVAGTDRDNSSACRERPRLWRRQNASAPP